ncbi:MAG TPA: class I SAM-dependent methyltransferase [Pirellulales bacterium]|nr:class I SAM-dependent methyltransferase [Pirellulales bacterium]
MTVALKIMLKSGIRRAFVLGQRIGFDLLPRHFYSEIPAIDMLRRTQHWRKPFSMTGVAGAGTQEQLDFVRATCTAPLTARLRQLAIHDQACRHNGEIGFGVVEADFLFCFIRSHRPSRIVQIGCGVSTAVCLLAAMEAGYRPEIVCIEPYPNRFLREAARKGEIRLVEERAQEIDFDVCGPWAAGDLFFVDSTHTLGPAGEVTRIVLEMLPLLPEGAWVHFHDIVFPYDYPRELLSSELFFGHESALLLAFLTYNPRFAIAASLSMLHYARPEELGRLLPNYHPAGNDDGLRTTLGHFPSSTYLKVVAG